jgi:hypothetical protein
MIDFHFDIVANLVLAFFAALAKVVLPLLLSLCFPGDLGSVIKANAALKSLSALSGPCPPPTQPRPAAV